MLLNYTNLQIVNSTWMMRKSVSAGNIRNLYNTLEYYNTCKQTDSYKIELKNLLDEIQKNRDQKE